MPAGGPAAMSTETSTSTAAVAATLPRESKPGRVPIKSWAIDLETETPPQGTWLDSPLPSAHDGSLSSAT
jgi:hypothetical protein